MNTTNMLKEKKIFLENYIEMVKGVRGEKIADEKNIRLKKDYV